MKIFELKYIRSNNGETGVTSSYNIAQSTNEEVILDIINKNHLNYVTELERGQEHVFLLRSWEPNIEPYFNEDYLKAAIADNTKYQVELAEARYEYKQIANKRLAESIATEKGIQEVSDSLKNYVPQASGPIDEELDNMTKAFAQVLGLDK